MCPGPTSPRGDRPVVLTVARRGRRRTAGALPGRVSCTFEFHVHRHPDRFRRLAPAARPDRLGVTESELGGAVSLVHDLAADSLDLADVAAAIEDAIGITVPTALLERVRTYGDLRDLADALVRARARRARAGAELDVVVDRRRRRESWRPSAGVSPPERHGVAVRARRDRRAA